MYPLLNEQHNAMEVAVDVCRNDIVLGISSTASSVTSMNFLPYASNFKTAILFFLNAAASSNGWLLYTDLCALRSDLVQLP
jgi:hypothetical protein